MSASATLGMVASVMNENSARISIASRAHDGLIRTKATRFIRDKKTLDDVELPPEFWWARGHEALDQNWATGDFETWIDQKHWKAYGVRFFRSDVEKLLPAPTGASVVTNAVTIGPALKGNFGPFTPQEGHTLRSTAIVTPPTAQLDLVTAKATATVTVAARVTQLPEWTRTIPELRERLDRVENDLTGIRREVAAVESDRFGPGGNSPPEPIDATFLETMLAVRVVRDEVPLENPRPDVLALASAALERARQAIERWSTHSFDKFNSKFMGTMGTGVAGLVLAKLAGVETDLKAIVKSIEHLIRLLGGS